MLELEEIKTFQIYLDQISSLYIIYLPVNFLSSFIVSIISFPFFLYKVTNNNDLLKVLSSIKEISKNNKLYFFIYILTGGMVTGFISTALIAIQFSKLNIPTAIIYGIVGPFVLKNLFVETFKTRFMENMNDTINNITNEELNTYKSGLNNIKQEVDKLIKNK